VLLAISFPRILVCIYRSQFTGKIWPLLG